MLERPELSTREKVLLVGIIHGSLEEQVVASHLDELQLLTETAGGEVVGRITQRLTRLNSAYLLGKGKAEILINQAKALAVELIIFDDDLSPAQVKNYLALAKSIKVIDRTALILDIFRQHAHTREAKTQVELAHLQYLLPRLTRQWSHLERQMGGIGTRAGAGETQIEVDRRLIRERISTLRKELSRIEKERTTQSKKRQQYYRIALVGYTNAGKSTLLQTLSGAELYIRDQLFATLDTTVRGVAVDEKHTVLISDTVGFIRKLPHHLVASFRSTLKEVVEANLILIVLDATSSHISEHYRTILEVLEILQAAQKRALIVVNKIDRVDIPEQISELKHRFPDSVLISAKNHLRIEKLLARIKSIMEEGYQTVEIRLPYNQGRRFALAQQGVEVLDRWYSEDQMILRIRGQKDRVDHILYTLAQPEI